MNYNDLDTEEMKKKYGHLYDKKSTVAALQFHLVLSPIAFFYRRTVFMLAMVIFFKYPVF